MELISAIATAQGCGGVAIVRVSGEGALRLARAMFSRKGDYLHGRLYAGEIDCGSFRDYGMCVFFKAPHSFTGEDVVEFHCHGGEEIARGILRRTVQLGARPAERGEFTRRAFLNGKLSLSAAEGMADMIAARSEAQVRAGYLLYGEKLTAEGKRLQEKLKTCLASADVDVDYPEEDLGAASRAEISSVLADVSEALSALEGQYTAGRKVKNGVRVVLCGRPNAGKSTLFNALMGYERAIVSPRAGTTRDVLEGETELNGVRFLLTDTAGLRESADELEAEGVRRARRALDAADLIVYLKEEGDAPAFPEGIPVLTVGAKCDIVRREGCDLPVSALTGEGIEALKERIYALGFGRENGDVFLMDERHYFAVREAKACVEGAIAAVREGLPAELYAEDLRHAFLALGTLGGETASEAVIEEIFSKFCVGK